MFGITYLQAIVLGILQGVTELFPISSLGHSVLVPALLGGSWHHLVTQASTGNSKTSPYLAFIVALHVATAIGLIIFYRKTWIKLIKSFFTTLSTRKIEGSDQRLIWLLLVATIPAALAGLVFEHAFRVLFAKPEAAAIFLTINGLILLGAEWLRRRPENALVKHHQKLTTLPFIDAGVIGVFQTAALLAGISRSGITLVGGLIRGLSHEDAANFSFLMATPIILAAGLLELPELFGPAGHGIGGQVIVGALAAAVAAYLSVRFLTRYFQTRTLTPFGIYCLVFGAFCIIRFA